MPDSFTPDPSLGQANSTGFNSAKATLSHSNTLNQATQPTLDAQGNPITGFAALKQNLGALGQDVTNVLPTIGAIGGGLLGGAAGAAAGIETGPGAIATGYAGGVAGAGMGAAGGEALKEKLQGQSINPGQVAKQGGIYAGLEAVGGPIVSTVGKALGAVGEFAAKAFIPKSDAEAGMLQAYQGSFPTLASRIQAIATGNYTPPTTAAGAAFKQGIAGFESMMGVQAKRVQNKLWSNTIGPALKDSEKTISVDMPKFFDAAEAKIKASTPELTRQNTLLNALNSIREDYQGVTSKNLTQLQKLKEGWAEFVPEKAYKGQPIGGALNDVRNTLAGMAREKIYSSLGDNVKQAYLDYGNLEGIKALGKKAMAGGLIKAGGTFTGIKNLLESATVPIGTVGGQVLYKVGQGVEMVGAPGARALRDLVGIPTDASPNTTDQPAGFVPDASAGK